MVSGVLLVNRVDDGVEVLVLLVVEVSGVDVLVDVEVLKREELTGF